jgi:fumarate reductase flavoprotein subunit
MDPAEAVSVPAFEFTVPVLIAGGGACGAVAALAARDAGAEVLLLEQDAAPSGTTSMSQGLICAAGTAAQRRAGVEDGPDRFFADIMAKTRGLADPVLARTIADEAGPCVDWLIQSHDVPYDLDVRFRAAYGHTALRVHGWPGRGGGDVLQLLHSRLGAAGADVLAAARLCEVFTHPDGRIVGVEVERPKGVRERIGCGALVMAMGGFAANAAMVARHMPEAAKAGYNGHEGSRGDAMILGERLGAAFGDMGAYQGYAMLTDPQGVTVPPGVVVEGGLLVNAAGDRFVDETLDIAGMVHPVLAQPGGRAWVVYDAEIEARCAYIPETQQLLELRAARCADTVEGLAGQMGVPPAALEGALDDAYRAQARGGPDAVGRSWSEAPPPTAPFRALKVRGAIYHTQGGLQVDGRARVRRADGAAFPNLFAGGGSARGVSGPSYWGYLPAMGLCCAATLGRLAGASAAEAAAVMARPGG